MDGNTEFPRVERDYFMTIVDALIAYTQARDARLRREIRADFAAELIAARAAVLDPPGQLLTVAQFARRKGVSVATINRLRPEGLPVVMVGDRPKIDPAVADPWIAARGRKPTTQPKRATRVDDVDVSGPLARAGYRLIGVAR
jgi:hypothetical protein